MIQGAQDTCDTIIHRGHGFFITWEQIGHLRELAGLAFSKLPQVPVPVELVLWLSVPVQPHNMVAYVMVALEIYRKLLTQISGIPVN